MREIALFASAIQPSYGIVMFFVFVRITLPYFVRWNQFGNAWHNFSWDSWLYSVLDLLFGGFMIFINYVFAFAGYIDFHRREQMLIACGVLLDPLKQNHDPIYRHFPTINLLDV